MKSTGMVRKVDELGRVVIPIELRRNLGIDTQDPVEIFVDDDAVIMKKYSPQNACIVTGEISDENLSLFGGKLVLSPSVADDLLKQLYRMR